MIADLLAGFVIGSLSTGIAFIVARPWTSEADKLRAKIKHLTNHHLVIDNERDDTQRSLANLKHFIRAIAKEAGVIQ